ncbi:MAG: cyclase family protein [Candidatus Izemoplasma sp.]|nr:cyclase family protein [Candidatus Izemoplasma sp.]
MIYDISMLIHEDMQVYKNKPEKAPKITVDGTHQTSSAHESRIEMNLHTGTHMDFPLHMIPQGKTSETEQLKPLIGQAKVFDMTQCKDHIGLDDVKKLNINKDDFILFKTQNSMTDAFLMEFIYVNEAASEYLKNQQIRGVGIDGLGIERAQKDHPTHKILLGADIIIIEGLRLKDVPEGDYQLYALPLKIKDVEALPLRAILID